MIDFNVWNKSPSNPILLASAAWEGPQIQDGCTIKINGLYYRFYCAGIGLDQWGIGYATATAAQFPTTWTKYPGNPVILPTSINRQPAAPRVILMPDGSYRMYFHSWAGGATPDVGRLATCSAAEFPNTWHYQDLEILNNGITGAWDSKYVQTQNFIPPWDAPDGLWHMHYGGYDSQINSIGTGTWRGGHATSIDGITWTRDPANPILNLGTDSWESIHVLPLGWCKINGLFYITYQGFYNGIWQLGYITSTDLWTYTRHSPSVPCVPVTPGGWDSYSVEGVDIYQESGLNQLFLFYCGDSISWGGSYKTGLATLDLPVIAPITARIVLSTGPLRIRTGRTVLQIGLRDYEDNTSPIRMMTPLGKRLLI